jgi:prophage antirepressor-like protein
MKKIKIERKKMYRTAYVRNANGKLEKVTLVNMDGLDELIKHAPNQEIAQKFKKWIDSEVLPAINKTREPQQDMNMEKALAANEKIIQKFKKIGS